MNAERPSDRDSSRSSRYDFDRLERSVGHLLKDHERLAAEREALLEELVDREQRIAALEAKLSAERERCANALEAVDQVISKLDQLESEVVEIGASPGSGA
jgi:predicted  nucleic acid-binding Zn-ribbon protein